MNKLSNVLNLISKFSKIAEYGSKVLAHVASFAASFPRFNSETKDVNNNNIVDDEE
jgi:hypothetical protein